MNGQDSRPELERQAGEYAVDIKLATSGSRRASRRDQHENLGKKSF
jgi:hypothetical protein